MTEAEAKTYLGRDAETSAAPTLSADEIADAVRAWLYVAGSFDTASTTADHRYMRAVAQAWRKKAGKEVDPLARINEALPPETRSLNDNCIEMERRWLNAADEAERRANLAAAVETDSISTARTRAVRNVAVF